MVPIVPGSTPLNQVIMESTSRACRRCGDVEDQPGTHGLGIFGWECNACANFIPGFYYLADVGGVPVWELTEQHERAIEAWKMALKTNKQYWYLITWTHNDNHTIDDVWQNVYKFLARDLGFIECDAVLETGTANGREHIHLRCKLQRALKKQKLGHYEKAGHIDFVTIKKHTKENWENLEGYMSKEGEIIAFYRDSKWCGIGDRDES